jgi:iron complex transport system substrate-binding protein
VLDRRTFLLSALALLTTSSCSDSDTPAATTASKKPGAKQADYPRTVQHELGSTTLEQAPQRVVCGTDGAELCSMLALGLEPVGYGKRQDPTPSWLEGRVDGLEHYELSGGETSFEQLAAWAPDLLLVQKGFATADTMARFTDIAPTVATSFADWRTNLRQVGQAVGLEKEAQALEAEKDAVVEEAKGRLPASAAGLRVNVMMAFDDGSIYVLNEQSPAGKISAALGLAPLPQQATQGEVADLLSPERLSTVDGDLLVLMHFGDGDGLPALQQKSLYKDLAVVKAGQVVDLTRDESDSLYFDSVLTVEPNVALLERLIAGATA